MGVPHLALSDLNKKFKDLGYISTNKTYVPASESVYWMPLHDDGHAFRLGNALQIDILHNWESVTAQWALGQFCREKCTDETRNKATRRAIVRAVANQEWSMSRCTKNETQV